MRARRGRNSGAGRRRWEHLCFRDPSGIAAIGIDRCEPVISRLRGCPPAAAQGRTPPVKHSRDDPVAVAAESRPLRLLGEGWRPAVVGTGGIQEDRVPGASDRYFDGPPRRLRRRERIHAPYRRPLPECPGLSPSGLRRAAVFAARTIVEPLDDSRLPQPQLADCDDRRELLPVTARVDSAASGLDEACRCDADHA